MTYFCSEIKLQIVKQRVWRGFVSAVGGGGLTPPRVFKQSFLRKAHMSCNAGNGVGGKWAEGQGVGPAESGFHANRPLSPLISRLLEGLGGGGGAGGER